MKIGYSCYYCKSKEIKLILSIDKSYKLLNCRRCDLTYTYPMERLRVSNVNNQKYNSKAEERSYLGIYDNLYKRAYKYAKNIKKYKKNGKYLDVGCSFGIYMKAAKDIGYEVSGVEIADNAARYARDQFDLDVFIGTLEKAKYKENTFDVVTIYDVLEHIPDINIFLNEINRILKPGGVLVIQCPNIESLAFAILKQKWNWLLVPNHLWHFSKRSFIRILDDTGFSIVKITTWDDVYDFASNWVTKMRLTRPNASVRLRIWRKFTYFILYSLIFIGSSIWCKYNKGGEILLYARKDR